jgi:GNAT superfamily N-acetyltransferase/acyl carrier protein
VTLRERFRAAASDWGIGDPALLDDDAPLTTADGFDSLTLFKIIVWVEEQTGQALDPTAVDLTEAWATVGDLLHFVATRAGSPPSSSVCTGSRPQNTVTLGTRRYRIVDYTPEHASQVATLMTGLWSPDETLNRQYLHWKYSLNPYRDGSRIFLAMHADEVVGIRGFYGANWERGGIVEHVLMADDLFVHPDHRNVGLYEHLMATALGELRTTGAAGVLNLSANPANTVASLATGWSVGGAFLPLALTRRNALAGLRRWLARQPMLWRLAPRVLSSDERAPFRRLPTNSTRHPLGCSITFERVPRIAEMAQLVARNEVSTRLRHVRDETFFRWRLENPLSDYRYVFADDGGTLAGFLVLRTLRAPFQPNGEVRVVDYEARDTAVLAALLETALRQHFPRLTIWTTSLPPVLRQSLHALGLEAPAGDPSVPDWPCALVHRLNEANSDSLFGVPLDEDAWDMRQIFSMGG